MIFIIFMGNKTYATMYAILTDCPLFRGLGQDRIKELLEDRQFSVDSFKDGDVIARRDVAYSGLMIVLEGGVRGEHLDTDGKVVGIYDISAPQLISPAYLFGGYNRLPIDVIADGDVKIMTLHRGIIFELMQENMIIMSNFIDIISNRANMLTRKMYFLSFKSLKDKLVRYIAGHTGDGSRSFEMADMNELSEYFDASRISIQEVLDGMVKSGVISLSGRKLTVEKPERLK